MQSQMREVLAQGVLEGQGPERISKLLTDRVDKIGRTRATTNSPD